jgi:hypothetical protein
MLVSITLTIAVAISFFGYKKFKSKKTLNLKSGDLVLLKRKYFHQFPQLPQNHPMHVEAVEKEMVDVVFMDTKATYQKTVPLFALHKVTG